MSKSFRKFLAATEAAGGVAVLALPGILSRQGYSLDWWYWILLASFGGFAVAAGIWLWRDDPRGWTLSRILQAAQIIQFQTAAWESRSWRGFSCGF